MTEEKDVCETCGNEFPKDQLYYGPDPYAEDIYGDTTPTVLCKECYQTSCDDI